MRAAVCPAYGPPEVVRLRESAAPRPPAGQVGVPVAAPRGKIPELVFNHHKKNGRGPPA